MFTANPVWCAISYSYTISDAMGNGVLYFDVASHTFTFAQLGDLTAAGSTFTDYVITVTGSTGNITPQTASASFTMTVKNPCIDSDYVSIQAVPLPVGESYALYAFDAVNRYEFSHSDFIVVT